MNRSGERGAAGSRRWCFARCVPTVLCTLDAARSCPITAKVKQHQRLRGWRRLIEPCHADVAPGRSPESFLCVPASLPGCGFEKGSEKAQKLLRWAGSVVQQRCAAEGPGTLATAVRIPPGTPEAHRIGAGVPGSPWARAGGRGGHVSRPHRGHVALS